MVIGQPSQIVHIPNRKYNKPVLQNVQPKIDDNKSKIFKTITDVPEKHWGVYG